MRHYGPGNGPLCPDNPKHGRLYTHLDWTEKPYWCPTHSHGGNGQFYTEAEAYGEKPTEGQLTAQLEPYARDVIAGNKTFDQAVTEAARDTKKSSSHVRESLRHLIDVINDGANAPDVVERKREARAEARKQTQAQQAVAAGRKVDRVSGEEFEKVRVASGLTKKQLAAATGQAGMGASSTYVFILLKDGASANLFERYKAAVAAYLATSEAEEAAEELEEEVEAVTA